MKFLSSILIVLSATVTLSDGRRATTSSSLASVPRRRGDLRTNKAAFVNKQSSSWTNDAKEVRGGEGGGTATMTNEMFNLVKGVVGVGVLSLPAGELAINVHNIWW